MLCRCKSSTETYIDTIAIDNTNIQNAQPIDNYINNVNFVKLKMPKNKFIALISHVIEYKDKFYLHDQSGNQLFIFDNKGNFLNQVGKKGEGPEEYGNIKTFYIDKFRQEIQVYDVGNGKILHFDELGNYKRTLPYNCYLGDKVILEKQQILLTRGYDNKHFTKNKNYRFMLLNNQHKIIRGISIFPEEDILSIKNGILRNFSTYNDKLLFCEVFNDTISEFANNKIYPRYVLHFKKNSPSSAQVKLLQRDAQELQQEKYPYLFKYFVEKDSTCFFNYSYNRGQIHFVAYNKSSKKITNNCKAVTYRGSLLPVPEINADESLITVINAEQMSLLRKISPIVKQNTTAQDTSYLANPILLVYKLKK